MAEEPGQFRYIVRIAGTDVEGTWKLVYGLAKIKGIGVTTAHAICRVLGIDPEKRVGFLTDSEIKKIEKAVEDLRALGLPAWLYNRRKDYETGEDMHLHGANLIWAARKDIDREKKIRSWRGLRHAVGLKVRGQRTHTTGRLGVTVGVKKKKK
ncbi:MAG: 30S ribosomal protein S13 [Desulfurococcales archaeon]|nr:30S ribosomal protein S13 [Desulfurococcales archaeon]